MGEFSFGHWLRALIWKVTGKGREESIGPGLLSARERGIIESTRQRCAADCELAAELLRRDLPGGSKRRYAGERLLHEVYEYQGKVFDVTAKQFVRPGLWTEEDLAHIGLTEAVETGAFTSQQHRVFMDKVIGGLGGVRD